MSKIDVSIINKKSFKHKIEEKQKEKDKEKETSNLLEEKQNQKRNQNQPFIYSRKKNELLWFILLTAFIFVIYILTRLKPALRGVDQVIGDKIINNSFYHEMESNNLINSFDNKYKNIYPEIPLELKNEFPNLEQIFNSRILYIKDSKLTSSYLRHIRPFEDKEEDQFRPELYDNLIPNDTWSEDRENLINTDNFIYLCNKETIINIETINITDKPLISIILPAYNKKNEIIKSIRSIQNQSFKSIEIIIIDDFSSENATDIYNYLLSNDKRIRVFYHMKNMGVFKSRLDGFLYSRGKYILFFDTGDLFSDNLVLEDIYKIIVKYNLDSVRFAFKKYKETEKNKYEITTHFYPPKDINIKYGKVRDNVHYFGYGTIWNRLIRANVITKGLDLIDSYILNAYKNLWEDVWWNELVNVVTFSHLTINRIGYIYYSSENGEGNIKISTEEERDKTIREFIYFWLFDYQLTRPDSKKTHIINTLRQYSSPGNKFYGIPINLSYLRTNFTIYKHLLNTLINDYFVKDDDKFFLNQLLANYNINVE